MRDDRERLRDILDAIREIERYEARGREAFEKDELIRTWMVHHLLIVGEAASAITRSVREASPQIAWPQIVAMRNILIHEYFGVDSAEVWSAVKNDLPPLKRQLQILLDSMAQD